MPSGAISSSIALKPPDHRRAPSPPQQQQQQQPAQSRESRAPIRSTNGKLDAGGPHNSDWWDRFAVNKRMFYIKLSGGLGLLVLVVLCLVGYTHMTASDPAGLLAASQLHEVAPAGIGTGKFFKSNRVVQLSGCENLDGFAQVSAKVASLQEDVNRIIRYQLEGAGRNSTYNELALFCDTFGPRMSGSRSLERAIEYLRHKMQFESKLQVAAEPAMVPNWVPVRGTCALLAPVAKEMRIAVLGQSVSTDGPLEASVVLVHDFEELERVGRAGALAGKIVVFNHKFTTYGDTVKYRTQGALRAAKLGAAAALVRSITPFSMDTPHAGAASKSIPTAAITIEDADLIERWLARNKSVSVRLDIETQHNADAKSFNLIGDIPGRARPSEIVFVSGHMDSWYNTPGAMDDGGGMMISLMALDLLSKLNMRAERTMRAILWTAEEPGLVGAKQYFEDHKHELENFKAVLESDEGTFKPRGLAFKNLGPLGQCTMNRVLALTAQLGTTHLSDAYEGSDIELFSDAGVAAMSLLQDNERYFWFHHTAADSMEVEDPDALDRATALFAAVTYVLANLDTDLRH